MTNNRSAPVVLAMQITLALCLLAAAQAGVYTGDAFSFYEAEGYVPKDAVIDAQTAWLGSLASVCAIGTLIPAALMWRKLSIKLIAPILAYALISALWSNVLSETAWISAKIVIYGTGASYLTHTLTGRQIRLTFVLTALLAGLLSLYLIYSDPIFSNALGVPGWRGFFATKNGLGAFCVYTIVLISSFLGVHRGWGRVLACACLVFLFFLLIMSRSKTGMILCFMYGISVWLLLRFDKPGTTVRQRRRHIFTAIASFSLVAALILPLVAVQVGTRELTFTGRTNVWNYFLQYFTSNPIFGLGGYSVGLDSFISQKAVQQVGMVTPDSSYVILLANQGLLGLVIYVFVIFLLFKNLYENATKFSYYSVCGLLVYLAYGFMESGSQFSLSLGTITVLIQQTLAAKAYRSAKARAHLQQKDRTAIQALAAKRPANG